MNRSNMKAYIAALSNSALNRRSALQTELAVGFAVILESGESRKLARIQLVEIYASAGYKCRQPSDIDYKTINRRVAAAVALFDFMGEAEVRQWAGDLTRAPLLNALVERLAPLKLTTINEVLEVCSKSKNGEKSNRGRKPGIRIDTEHLHLTVPTTATREELLEAAMQLMKLANEMVNRELESEPEPELEAA